MILAMTIVLWPNCYNFMRAGRKKRHRQQKNFEYNEEMVLTVVAVSGIGYFTSS